jgi:hypothetical protein
MGFVGIYPYGTIQIFLKVVYKISIPVWICTNNSIIFFSMVLSTLLSHSHCSHVIKISLILCFLHMSCPLSTCKGENFLRQLCKLLLSPRKFIFLIKLPLSDNEKIANGTLKQINFCKTSLRYYLSSHCPPLFLLTKS